MSRLRAVLGLARWTPGDSLGCSVVASVLRAACARGGNCEPPLKERAFSDLLEDRSSPSLRT